VSSLEFMSRDIFFSFNQCYTSLMLNIGFSTGCLYRIFDKVNSKEAIDSITLTNSNCIELLVRDFEQIDSLLEIDPEWLDSFSHISIHAPVKCEYDDNNQTREALEKLSIVQQKLNARLVVLHPDLVRDWSLIKEYSTLPFAIENMDDRKSCYKEPEELKKHIEGYDLKFLLDLQHIYVNDSSFKLCEKFLDMYLDDLEEIHVSSYDERFIHYLLHKKEQDVILEGLKGVIRKKNMPVIIEGSVNRKSELQVELDYIRKFFA
jgi:hypothetical protein